MACHLLTHEAQWITWPISWKQIKQCLKPLDRNQPFKRLSIDIKHFNYCFDFYFLHNPNVINVSWWLILIKFPGLLVAFFFLWNCNLKSCKMSPNLYSTLITLTQKNSIFCWITTIKVFTGVQVDTSTISACRPLIFNLSIHERLQKYDFLFFCIFWRTYED